jgi:hypothetical protein
MLARCCNNIPLVASQAAFGAALPCQWFLDPGGFIAGLWPAVRSTALRRWGAGCKAGRKPEFGQEALRNSYDEAGVWRAGGAGDIAYCGACALR